MKQNIEIVKRTRKEYENKLAAQIARRTMEWTLDMGYYCYSTWVHPEARKSQITIYLDGKGLPPVDEESQPTKTILSVHYRYDEFKRETTKYYTFEVRYDWD